MPFRARRRDRRRSGRRSSRTTGHQAHRVGVELVRQIALGGGAVLEERLEGIADGAGSMPLRTGPKNCQWPLVKRIIRICSTVAWSLGLVLIWMPGTIMGICRPLIERACFMMFSRDSRRRILQDLEMSLAVQIGVNGLAVRLADARDIPLHEGAPFTERRGPRGRRILALHPVHRRHDAFGVFHARRRHYGRHRFRHRGKEMHRLPTDFGIALDRHGGEFRRGELHEDVGARGLELGDLGVDSGVRHLVRRSATIGILPPRPSFRPLR